MFSRNACPRDVISMRKKTALLVGILFIATGLLVSCGGNEAVTGTLTKFSGPVEVMAGGQTLPAAAGLALAVDSVLKTGAGGKAQVDFSDGARILVEENSELRMKELGRPSPESTIDIVVELARGLIYFNVTERKNSRFQMDSSVAVSGVKGTRGTMQVSPEDQIMNRWLLAEGKLEVTSKADATKTVTIVKDEQATFDKDGNVAKSAVDPATARFGGVPFFVAEPDIDIKVRTGN